MIASTPSGVRIVIRVVPRAGRSSIAGTRDDALLVRLNAAPVEGAANAELVEVIARALNVPKRAVSIVTGERSRRKTLDVSGISIDEARSKLLHAG